MRRGLIAAMVAALAVFSAARLCLGRRPFENQWGPFTGTVVDADTGQPVPGAVFTVFWIKEISFLFQGLERFFDARVVVADEQGHFEIPRRSQPFLFLGVVKQPTLSCIAPDYAPFKDVGAQNAPISVKLRRLSPEEIRLSLFSDVHLGVIPDDKASELEKVINQSRKRLGLRPIYFPSGGYRKE